jgi:glutamate carboxypeptidase
MKEKVFSYIDSKKDEMVALWRDLVNTESGTRSPEDVDKIAAKIAGVLEEMGAKTRIVEFEEAGNMVLGEVGAGEKPAAFLCGHMDTVFQHGETEKRPFTIKDGIAYGPGVLDMKGGIVIAIYAAKALLAAGFSDRPIKFAFAGDEESAHPHSNAADVFIEAAKGCAAAFDCETAFTDNSVVIGRKGMAEFRVGVTGVASHAGNDPKRGRSAILEMAHKIIEIQKLTNWEEGYTFNVGTITGGTVPNAVPGYCEIAVDIRYLDPAIAPKLKEMVEGVLAKTYVEGTKTELLSFRLGINAMKTTDREKKLFALWQKVSADNGFNDPEPTPLYSGGASDAAYTVMAGVPSLCSMGVKGGKNHSTDEFAVVDSLFERAKMLAAMIMRLDEM